MATTVSLRHLLTSIPKGSPFQKSVFHFVLPSHALDVPSEHIGRIHEKIDSMYFLRVSKYKSVRPLPENYKPELETALRQKRRFLVMNHELTESDMEKFKTSYDAFLKDYDISITAFDVIIDYDYWGVDEVLDVILPESVHRISSFETVGHIAHLNLQPEHDPFLSIIGNVILDKNPAIKTVVSKSGAIENTFRVFPMKIIAGEDTMIAQVKENGCLFRFDYSKVYWNSRLENEHGRIIDICPSKSLVCDIFAGVGPFSVPLLRKGCTVFANDLNPSSCQYLNENAKSNKVPLSRLHSYNLDGREFIHTSHKDLAKLKEIPDDQFMFFDHYIMNLPALAYSFLDEFHGIAKDKQITGSMPLIHCYVFVRLSEDPLEIIRSALGGYNLTESDDELVMHNFRRVAPTKDMYCMSFRLPEDYARGESTFSRPKKMKAENNKD